MLTQIFILPNLIQFPDQ